MRVKTTSTKVYTFDELSDDAKDAARDWYRNGITSHEDWGADTVIEDAARLAGMFGLNIRTRPVKLMGGGTRNEPSVYWALDRDKGASFEGYYSYKAGSARAVASEAPSTHRNRQTGETHTSTANTVLNNIVDALAGLQRRNFYQLTAAITHHRSHGSPDIDVEVERADGKAFADADDARDVEQCLRDFADWIATGLETEYEYQTSAECIDETILENEYEFTKDGRRA